MGDRANIKMVYRNGEEIYFYTHHGGSQLPEMKMIFCPKCRDWGWIIDSLWKGIHYYRCMNCGHSWEIERDERMEEKC
jgi:predicted  nucleic acid-binding Zn ribbon protein